MSDTKPGADELRIRAHLRQLVDGLSVEPPPAVHSEDWVDDILASDPAPAPQPVVVPERAPKKDWWGPLYQDDKADLDTFTGNTPTPTIPPRHVPAVEDDDQDQDNGADEGEEASAEAPVKARWWPLRKTGQDDGERPTTAPKKPRPAAPEAPRQSLLEAIDRVPRRLKQLAYHATAATAGWWLGWVDWGTDTAAWYAAGHWTTPSAWVLYGLGLCVYALYRRSRTWAWPAAWCAAVPVSSVVAGVLLYGTGYPS